MNLLPHKSWNIWSSKNIARIERDEIAFEREQREEQLEKVQRERDSRLDKLRKKVRGEEEKNEVSATSGDGGRVLLFEKEERQANQLKEKKKNTILNNTIKDNLKDSLQVPWYVCRTEEERRGENQGQVEEQDPLKAIQEWEAKEKRKFKERKRKREEKSRETETIQRCHQGKRKPTFIRLDKNHKGSLDIWKQLRTSYQDS